MTRMPILHIHAQSYFHQPAFLIGNHDGLMALYEAIGRVLFSNDATWIAELYQSDGEGFPLVLALRANSALDAADHAYTDTEVCGYPRGSGPYGDAEIVAALKSMDHSAKPEGK